MGGNLYQNIAGGVVSPHKVKIGVRDRRIPPGRIAGDIERMVMTFHNRKPGLVNGIEHRGGNLADATAHRIGVLAIDDGARSQEPLLLVAIPRCPVVRPRLAGFADGVVEYLGDQLDIVVAILGA